MPIRQYKPTSPGRRNSSGHTFAELTKNAAPAPKSPEASLACIKVRAGFTAELVASEPMIADPVNFDWGQGSPDPSIPVDGFSARWTGKVQAQYSETYTFYTNSDEGVALWVNGQQIIAIGEENHVYTYFLTDLYADVRTK